MAATRIPGPMSQTDRPVLIDSGTLCRGASTVPSARARSTDVAGWDSTKKLLEAAKRAGPKLPSEMREDFEVLFTPENIAVMMGIMGVWTVSHATPAGPITDAVLLGFGLYSLGHQAVDAGRSLGSFAGQAIYAQTDADLEAASSHFAHAVAVIGVGTFVALVMKTGSRFRRHRLTSISPNIQSFEKRLLGWLGKQPAASTLGESKRLTHARDILNKLQYKPKEVKERIALAGEFLAERGFPTEKIINELRGIDFSKPVKLHNVRGSKDVFTQRQVEGADGKLIWGNWFSKPGYSYHDVGIAKGNRTYKTYRVKPALREDVWALESYATPVNDTWSLKGTALPTGGGGKQYVIPDAIHLLEEF